MANERLINSVSVGVVFVEGPGEFAISNDEKTHVMAEVQEGMEGLAANEPNANLSFSYANLSSFVDITPWEGANWPGLPESFYHGIDAALWAKSIQKIYFFRGSEYVRIDPANGWQADPGYPKSISGNWPGVANGFENGIDAAIWAEKNEKIYMFKGSEYIRIDPANGWQVDPGYPKSIAGNWPGLDEEFTSDLDAALWSKTNEKIYFFKGDQYVRIDPNNGWQMDENYPKPIAGNWPGVPESFSGGFDAALWSEPNQKIYFFKKDRIVGKYLRIDPNNNWEMDNNYPKPIGLGWGEAEAKWRDPALTSLGFSTGGDGIEEITEFFQNAVNAQFGFVAFFTKLPTVWFAYAGGLRIVMRKTVTDTSQSFEDWTSIDRIFAHETGHIFAAPDEYSSSNCGCEGEHGRFFKTHNGNCSNCAIDPTSCLMKNNTLNQICEYTRLAFGWPAFLTGIDAALYSMANNKIYMFSENYYVRFSSDFSLDSGYPKPIECNWPCLPRDYEDGIDASLYSVPNNKIYFFKDNHYVRIDPNNDWKVDDFYPKKIEGNWPGFPASFASGVDAALWSPPNNKIYFFKDDQYIRVDPSNGWQVDADYPKPIAGNWPGFPEQFASGIDAALWSESNQRIYFFKGSRYIRVNPANGWNVDSGYPKWINNNWKMPFPKTPL